MSQDFTDDSFDGKHIVELDMQNIENNFTALKSSFSGSSSPSNPIGGMLWFDIDIDQLYIRNAANNAWLTLDFESGTIMLFGQATSPTGWTKLLTWSDNSMLCINSQVDGTSLSSGGSANPQAGHTHTGPSHTHTVADHTHGLPVTFKLTGNLTGQWGKINADTTFSDGAGTTGSSGTGSTGSNSIPLYQEVIACTKD